MTERQKLLEKYRTRDIIEIHEDDIFKFSKWLNPKSTENILPDLRKLTENGFIRFLDKGVILLQRKTAGSFMGCYPFEYEEDRLLKASIYITNPKSNELQLAYKVSVGTDMIFNLVEEYQDVVNAHLDGEYFIEKLKPNSSKLCMFDGVVKARFPHLKKNTVEYREQLAAEYITTIIKSQIYYIVIINSYMALMDKQLLFSETKQRREMHASDKKHATRSKRNPFYRYVVKIPDHYQPRKFNLNYLLKEWQRVGFKATRWVREENAEVLGNRPGCKITNVRRGKYVAVKVPVAPAIIHRKEENKGEKGVKLYKNS